DLFLSVLEQVRKRYRLVVLGDVVIPEHFHLLISEPQRGTPSTGMQALKLSFARRVLAGMRRRGAPASLWEESLPHIWQARFYDFNVWSEPKRIEKLRYMHRNPVKRGLVPEPHKWRWSSFRSYAYGEAGQVRINEWKVLAMKEPDRAPDSPRSHCCCHRPRSRKPRDLDGIRAKARSENPVVLV
ncbi:MAG TPA: transposase, partial [Terriglobales bacterium]